MHGSFYGWYFKCQSDKHTIAVIPAVHQVGHNKTCSIQLTERYISIGRNIYFTGIIGVVLWEGKEYRIATYLGARAALIENRRVKIVQGNLELEAWLLEKDGHPLKAPKTGNMVRTIHESVASRACYRFRKKRDYFVFF